MNDVGSGTFGLVQRHLKAVVAERLKEAPVVVLTGARTVGKSTLMAACADAHGVPVFDLDDPQQLEMVRRDPTLFVTADMRRPVCIDEFQHELSLLSAIKAQLNREMTAGRYLLTGSTRYTMLPSTSQSLTGRAHIMTMWPLSQGELVGRRETALDQLITDPRTLVSAFPSTTQRRDYERLILAGGFPVALTRPTGDPRDRWFADFINLVIQRDVLDIRKVRQRQVIPEILRHLAAQTAQVLNNSTVANALELEAHLVGDLITLLESVFVVHRLHAFGRTLSARVGRSPKVHLVDSGLAAYLLRINETRLAARVPTTMTEFGHVVETFAVNELLKQAGWSEEIIDFSHFRTRDGHEVDLVMEARDGRIAGVEVKAASKITDQDFRGLRLLRDKIGSDFVGGVLLNLGQYSYTYDDRLYVVPLDRLWTPIT
ncbi:MAG TPA: ATP-binding protein [Pseudonocardiaceae bacterium]|nr:ATP-binding protein [Pseudonocardiaceae bacterium]